LKKAEPRAPAGRLVALISPHAGYRFSGRAAAHGFKLAGKLAGLRRVVVIGLSHRVPFRGISLPRVTHYKTPFGLMEVDLAAVAGLRSKTHYTNVTRAHMSEHSLEMQLPFLHMLKPHLKLVPMLTGFINAADLKEAAKPLVGLIDKNTLLIASSDHTHRGANFGYRPFAGK
jgi:AmmeMemoRadiSam system protein B